MPAKAGIQKKRTADKAGHEELEGVTKRAKVNTKNFSKAKDQVAVGAAKKGGGRARRKAGPRSTCYQFPLPSCPWISSRATRGCD
jgi:hypothetical protein